MDPPPLEFARTCRTCLTHGGPDDDMRSVFGGEANAQHDEQPPCQLELAAMLRSCAGTQIDRNDGLPECICAPCSQQLQAAFAFRLQCVQSHETLSTIYRGQLQLLQQPVEPKNHEQLQAAANDPEIKTEPGTAAADVSHMPEADENTAAMLVSTSFADDDGDDHIVDDHSTIDDDADDPDFTLYDIQDASDIEQVANVAADEVNSDSEPTPPPKRRRGRPRKTLERPPSGAVAIVTAVANASANSDGALHACPDCNRTFRRRIHMTRHQLIHSDAKPFACDHCEKRFRRQDHQQKHMRSLHPVEELRSSPKADNDQKYRCSPCDRDFARASHLVKHVRAMHPVEKTAKVDASKAAAAAAAAATTDGEEPTADGGDDAADEDAVTEDKTNYCTACQRGFTTPKNLALHQRMHERMFTCKCCGVKCADKDDLTEHSREHAGDEKPFLCSECGMRFVRNDYLMIHMRRHKGEKPYKCRYCGKGFPRATDLTVHERYHTGEKTHLCTTCGKGFHRAYNLVVHMRIHTGERPYQCSHCDRGFAQANDLKAHVRRHTGERYKCDVCGDGFIQGYHLTQHKQKVHGLDVQSHIRRVEKFTKKSVGRQRRQCAGEGGGSGVGGGDSAPVVVADEADEGTVSEDMEGDGGDPLLIMTEVLKIEKEEDNTDIVLAIAGGSPQAIDGRVSVRLAESDDVLE